MKRNDLIVLSGVVALGGLFLPAVIEAQSRSASRTKCANNLRQIGLAAIQYADDKRFFPHVNRILTLDGDVNTNHTPKVVRTLLWYGYHDNPEGWICPSSDDNFVPIKSKEVRNNLRSWFWGGKDTGSKTRSPLIDGADPKLSQTTELSYGYTRKGFNSNTRSTTILAADRAVRDGKSKGVLTGNHEDGWNVLHADGTVYYNSIRREPFPGATLVGTKRREGFLPLKPQTDPKPLQFEPKKPAATPWAGSYQEKGGARLLTLTPEDWSSRKGLWSFRGNLIDPTTKRGQTLYGHVTAGGPLKGIVHGTAGLAFEATLAGKALTMTLGKERVVFVITTIPTGITKERLMMGVAYALISAMRTNNRKAAEALFSEASLKLLSAQPGWFKKLRVRIVRKCSTEKRTKRFAREIARDVKEVEGSWKIVLR